jgi:hypothetical protein
VAAQSHERTKVFISYSHSDEVWLKRLRVHLHSLDRAKLIDYWCDKRIEAGAKWKEEIAQAIASTKVAILLVSADFIASDFIASDELPSLLNAAEKEGVSILPLIVNHSMFKDISSLSQFQTVNDPSKPLAGLSPVDVEDVLVKLTKDVERCLNHSPSGSASSSGFVDAPELRRIADDRPVTMPGLFRYFLDRCFPSVHKWLTTEVGLFKAPPELFVLNESLDRLRERIERDIRDKTYIEPPVRDVPDNAKRLETKRRGKDFFTPIQQVIKEIRGLSEGGDSQNAQISAISQKSKFVRNIVKRLTKAEEPLILLGDPGMGKTFTLQQAARLVALHESRRVFPKVCLFFRMGKFHMPVEDLVHVSEDELNKRRDDAVWAYVRKFAAPEVRPYLKSLATSKRLIIFFDGMDEMSRARYNDYTEALSVFAGNNKGRIKTLFSCRITDFTPTFQHYRLVLLPFTWKLIREYLERWFGNSPIVIGGDNFTARRLGKWLAKDTLPIQATNPFVLRLLCEYIQNKHDWPESRIHLLEYYVRSHYAEKTEAAARQGQSMPPADDSFLVWGRLAYELTMRNRGTEIPRSDLSQFLTSEQFPAVQAGKDCGVLLEAVDVEEREPVEIRFEHHRFQEFFTAYYLDKNRPVASTVNWLKKLDAPRWQETLFNLVLRGAGTEPLSALVQAIRQGLLRSRELKEPQRSENEEESGIDVEKSDAEVNTAKVELSEDEQRAAAELAAAAAQRAAAEKAAEAARNETMLADRVELASRILQQTQQQSSGEGRAKLLSAFQSAVNWLAEHGNPITKVKMLLAARIVPETDIWSIAQKVRASEVTWVHQQARIITWATDRRIEVSELQEEDPTLTVHGELVYSFASGVFLKHFINYVRISFGLDRRSGVWVTLALGLVLCLTQLFASYAVVATTRAALVPYFLVTEEWADGSAQRALDYLDWKTTQPGFEDPDGKVDAVRQRTDDASARFPTVVEAIKRTLDSWWFLLAANLTMFVTLLVSLRQAPGQQSFAFQTAGYVCVFLPLALHTLWLGSIGNVVLVIFFLLLSVPFVRTVGWVVTLLAHTLTLTLFSANTFIWTKRRLKMKPLLASMWHNAGFNSWGENVVGGLFGIAIYPVLVIAFSFATKVDWQRIGTELSRTLKEIPTPPPAAVVAVLVMLSGLAYVACLAVIARLSPWVRENDWRESLRTRSEGVQTWWAKPKLDDQAKEGLGALLGCLITVAVIGLAVWGLSFVEWSAFWKHLVATLGLFPHLPRYVNGGFSTAIYAESLGFLAALVAVLVGRRKALEGAGCWLLAWTFLCGLAALVVLAAWKIGSLEEGAIPDFIQATLGAFLGATLNLFGFLPSFINRLFSLAVYVEIIGCMVGLAVGLKKKEMAWERGRKIMKRTTWTALVIAALALVLWGVAILLDFLGASLYEVVITGRLGQLIVIVTMLVSVGIIIYFLAPLTDEMLRPHFKARFYSARTCEEWKLDFGELDPHTQAVFLKQVKRKMLGGRTDHQLLSMLEEVEGSVKEEPARSAYWKKRFEFEQITHQLEIG